MLLIYNVQNRQFYKNEKDNLQRDSTEEKNNEFFSENQKTVYKNNNKRKIYDKRNLVEKVVIHNRLIKNKKNLIIENE